MKSNIRPSPVVSFKNVSLMIMSVYNRFLLFALGIAFAATGCAQAPAATVLPPPAFDKTLQATPDAILLDVRTPEEYRASHLDRALNIDFYDQDFRDQCGRLDKNKPVFVYCAAGGRSESAAAILKKLGFAAVYDMQGGMRAWKAAGMKTVE
jgi:rhodanese-related sulfurtransferase